MVDGERYVPEEGDDPDSPDDDVGDADTKRLKPAGGSPEVMYYEESDESHEEQSLTGASKIEAAQSVWSVSCPRRRCSLSDCFLAGVRSRSGFSSSGTSGLRAGRRMWH